MKVYVKSTIRPWYDKDKDVDYFANIYYNERYDNADDAVEGDIYYYIRMNTPYSENYKDFKIKDLHLDSSSDCTPSEFFDKDEGTYHIRYDFNLSYEDGSYSLPFHIDYDCDREKDRLYGDIICDFAEEYSPYNSVKFALTELADRAHGIDRDKLIRYDNQLVDKDIYEYINDVKSFSSNYMDDISSRISDIDWSDVTVYLSSNSKHRRIELCYELFCDKHVGEKYIKSGEFDDDSCYPLSVHGECVQDHDAGIYYSIIDTAVFFPENPDENIKQQIVNYDINDIYDIVVDSTLDFINKNIAIYKKSNSKKKITQDKLLQEAEDVWDIVSEDDWQHNLSQEELIAEVIDRLEDSEHFDQKLTNNQKQIIKRELKTYGEFIYKGPNGLHYDTEQGWL